jgi:hypothetical protein
MDPQLLKIDLDIKDNCLDPQIIGYGIEWSVSVPSSAYNLSNDSKSLVFKNFQNNTRYI